MRGMYPIKAVRIDGEAKDSPLACRVLQKLDSHEGECFENAKEDTTGLHKETLHLVKFKGEFLKPCPGTREYICCGYRILNIAANCPIDCSYCILQSYLNEPGLRVFVNLEEKLEEVLRSIDAEPDRIFRVGTGEFTDSLALDPLTGWSSLLIPSFSTRKNALLELKTKTTFVDGAIRSGFRDRIVISWSLNSPYIAGRDEHGAPGLRKRLEAAGRCQGEGFVVGFHFDPLVHHPGWQEGYLRTIELMDRYIDPRKVIWVSLGTFRFMPDLKALIEKRHPESCLLNGEFIVGLDGKLRYFKPIRMEMYAHMEKHLHAWCRDLPLYLCMEADDVWEKGLGWSPRDSRGLSAYLDAQVVHFFG